MANHISEGLRRRFLFDHLDPETAENVASSGVFGVQCQLSHDHDPDDMSLEPWTSSFENDTEMNVSLTKTHDADNALSEIETSFASSATISADDAGEVSQVSVPRAFLNEEEFRSYFAQRTPLFMRTLLTQYTTVTSADELLKKHPYHHEGTWSDQEISEVFFEEFDHTSFLVYEHQTLPSQSLQSVTQVISGPLEEANQALTLAKTRQRELSSRHAAATKAAKRLEKFVAPPLERAYQNVYHYIRTKNTKQLMNDGGEGGTNAELTKGSMQAICTKLKEEFGVTPNDDVFLDVGASYGIPIAHVAQQIGCPTFGIEIGQLRAYLACLNLVTALNDKNEHGPLINTKIGYVHCDVRFIRDFGPATVVYSFDEAMPMDVVAHTAKTCRDTESVRLCLTFKGSKFPEAHRVYQECGFMLKTSLQVAKTGSGEQNTIYFYEKKSRHSARLCSTPVTSAVETSDPDWYITNPEMREKFLVIPWSGNREATITHFQAMADTLSASLPSKTRGRAKTSSTVDKSSCLCSIWTQCEGHCDLCSQRFKHLDSSFVCKRSSSIDGEGLFAKREIPADSLVREYKGATIKKPTGSAFTVELEPSKYVDAGSMTGIHKFINHSCTPNCRLVRWQDKEGLTRVSIYSLCFIPNGNELTVHYGEQYQKLIKKCLCPKCEA
jgi:hypothetical protein